jgi:peroxiredoxin family protein
VCFEASIIINIVLCFWGAQIIHKKGEKIKQKAETEMKAIALKIGKKKLDTDITRALKEKSGQQDGQIGSFTQ